MPKVPTAELRRVEGGWVARVTVRGKTRVSIPLQLNDESETAARALCSSLGAAAQRMRKQGHDAERIESFLRESATVGAVMPKLNLVFGVWLTDDEVLALLGRKGRARVMKHAT